MHPRTHYQKGHTRRERTHAMSLRKKTPLRRRRMLVTSKRAVEAEGRVESGEHMTRCWRTEITLSWLTTCVPTRNLSRQQTGK